MLDFDIPSFEASPANPCEITVKRPQGRPKYQSPLAELWEAFDLMQVGDELTWDVNRAYKTSCTVRVRAHRLGWKVAIKTVHAGRLTIKRKE